MKIKIHYQRSLIMHALQSGVDNKVGEMNDRLNTQIDPVLGADLHVEPETKQ